MISVQVIPDRDKASLIPAGSWQ